MVLYLIFFIYQLTVGIVATSGKLGTGPATSTLGCTKHMLAASSESDQRYLDIIVDLGVTFDDKTRSKLIPT